MHCKPLVIDYVMYAFVLLRPATIFYQLSIDPFPKKLAPETSLQGPPWPSSKIVCFCEKEEYG